MTDLIVVPQAAQWQRLKRLVLDSVSSPITRRVYNLGLDEFFAWYGQEPRPGFTKATVSAWRVALEARGLGAVSINVRITKSKSQDRRYVKWPPCAAGSSLIFDHEVVLVERSPGIANCHMLRVFLHQSLYRLYRVILGSTSYDNGFQIVRAD